MLVIIGSGLFVVPGLFALTVFGIVGPVIVIERLGAVEAFIRSARLSLPHIIIAFGAIALPFLSEQAIEDLMLLGVAAQSLGRAPWWRSASRSAWGSRSA